MKFLAPTQSAQEHWDGLCEAIGGKDAVTTRLAEVIHGQREGLAEPVCEECKNRARLFFDAAAQAEWWPLGYGIFKLIQEVS